MTTNIAYITSWYSMPFMATRLTYTTPWYSIH
jgi:hypothetical protein